jgi:hypothetical protein
MDITRLGSDQGKQNLALTGSKEKNEIPGAEPEKTKNNPKAVDNVDKVSLSTEASRRNAEIQQLARQTLNMIMANPGSAEAALRSFETSKVVSLLA